MLEGVINEGTGTQILGYEIPFNVIGKTGTTQNNGWFIGCSPELAIGTWVGTFDKRVQFSSTRMGSVANGALPIVASISNNISYWKWPLLTNFEYDFEYFPCRPFLEMSAEESQTFSLTDSIYLQELHMKNLDTIQTTSNVTDSILKLLPLQIQRDTIKKDTIQ